MVKNNILNRPITIISRKILHTLQSQEPGMQKMCNPIRRTQICRMAFAVIYRSIFIYIPCLHVGGLGYNLKRIDNTPLQVSTSIGEVVKSAEWYNPGRVYPFSIVCNSDLGTDATEAYFFVVSQLANSSSSNKK